MFNKKGQVWVETVIYTLIAFSLIAAVLAFVKPKIDEIQDSAIIEQSIGLLKGIDATIRDIIQGGAGNKRKLEISLKQGSLIIDGKLDKIIFELDSNYIYSEIGKEIREGNLIIKTTEKGNLNLVKMERQYTEEGYNITFNGKDELKTINKAATSYSLFITNKGKNDLDKWEIDIEIY